MNEDYGTNDFYYHYSKNNKNNDVEKSNYKKKVYEYLNLEYGIIVKELSSETRKTVYSLLMKCLYNGVNVPNAAGCISELISKDF